MDPTEIALKAARRLSVDVANLSFRLAVLESERDALHQAVMGLTPGTWKRAIQPVRQEGLVHDPDDVKTDVEAVIVITGEEAMMLETIIQALQDLV
jgi:hypothetical protein